MNNPSQFQELFYFAVGTRVDISYIAEMQGVEITRINESGVTIRGGGIGNYAVVSGKSPARLAQPKEAIVTLDEEGKAIAPKVRKDRGKEFKVTYPDKPFTILHFSTLNHISYPQSLIIIKDTCERVGYVEKIPGKRGKSAALFIKS